MKSFATFTVLTAAGVVLAQSSTGFSNPLIPANITPSCSSFLSALDTNDTITTCMNQIVNATSAFSPYNTNSTPSSSSVNTTLESLCSTELDSACSEASIRSQLSSFSTSCSSELTSSSPNSNVTEIYDAFFSLLPLKSAVCSKDDSGNRCLSRLSGALGGASGSTSPSSRLAKRGDSPTVTPVLKPNTTAIRESNLAFLFISDSMPAATLCTACTRAVMSAYFDYEQRTPYVTGIGQSLMLGNQLALYDYINKTCGSNFMNSAVQAAGSLSSNVITGAASRASVTDGVFTIAAAAVVGFAAML